MSAPLEGLRVRPSDDCVLREVGDETVILHLTRGTYFGLNATGTRIWQLVVGGAPADEIVDVLQQTHDLPREQVEADVRAFLTDLLENGIALPGDPGGGT